MPSATSISASRRVGGARGALDALLVPTVVVGLLGSGDRHLADGGRRPGGVRCRGRGGVVVAASAEGQGHGDDGHHRRASHGVLMPFLSAGQIARGVPGALVVRRLLTTDIQPRFYPSGGWRVNRRGRRGAGGDGGRLGRRSGPDRERHPVGARPCAPARRDPGQPAHAGDGPLRGAAGRVPRRQSRTGPRGSRAARRRGARDRPPAARRGRLGAQPGGVPPGLSGARGARDARDPPRRAAPHGRRHRAPGPPRGAAGRGRRRRPDRRLLRAQQRVPRAFRQGVGKRAPAGHAPTAHGPHGPVSTALALALRGTMRNSLAEHRAIARACRARSGRAEQLLRDHIRVPQHRLEATSSEEVVLAP